MPANPYLIPGSDDCLQNKLGFTDKALLAQAELEITSARLIELERNPIPGKLDYDHLKAIHYALFSDIYAWAGQERTVQTMKGITRFEWPSKIEAKTDALLTDLKNENYLRNTEREAFIKRAAHYFGELNVIHPFPEGNGRAQRVLFDQIAIGAGFQFNWSKTTKDHLIDAVVHAYAVDTSKLEVVFDQTLDFRTRAMEQENNTEFNFSIANPIEQSDYDNAVALVTSTRQHIQNALFPDNESSALLDESQQREVSRELSARCPDELSIKNAFEANRKVEKLFESWQQLDAELVRTGQGREDERLPSILQKKARILEQLIYRDSLRDRLTPHLNKLIKNEYTRVQNTLNRQRSRDIGLGR